MTLIRLHHSKEGKKDYNKNYLRNLYATRRENNLCTACGKVPPDPKSVKCKNCKSKAATRQRKLYNRKKQKC